MDSKTSEVMTKNNELEVASDQVFIEVLNNNKNNGRMSSSTSDQESS